MERSDTIMDTDLGTHVLSDTFTVHSDETRDGTRYLRLTAKPSSLKRPKLERKETKIDYDKLTLLEQKKIVTSVTDEKGTMETDTEDEKKIYSEIKSSSDVVAGFGTQSQGDNNVWQSTGEPRSKHYDPTPYIPFDEDISKSQVANEFILNHLPLTGEQKEQLIKDSLVDAIREKNRKEREATLLELVKKRKAAKKLEAPLKLHRESVKKAK